MKITDLINSSANTTASNASAINILLNLETMSENGLGQKSDDSSNSLPSPLSNPSLPSPSRNIIRSSTILDAPTVPRPNIRQLQGSTSLPSLASLSSFEQRPFSIHALLKTSKSTAIESAVGLPSFSVSATSSPTVPAASFRSSSPSTEHDHSNCSHDHEDTATTLSQLSSYPSPSIAHGRPSTAQGQNQYTINTTAAETPKRFPCTEPGCEKSFTRRYNLSAHLRCHRSEKPFACTDCDFKFARKHDLTRHVSSLHEMKRSYGPCGHCGAFFTRSDDT